MSTKTKLTLSIWSLTASSLLTLFGGALGFNIFHYLAVLVAAVVSVVCLKSYARELKEELATETNVQIESGEATAEGIRKKRRRGVFLVYGTALVSVLFFSLVVPWPASSDGIRLVVVLSSVVIILGLCGLSIWRASNAN